MADMCCVDDVVDPEGGRLVYEPPIPHDCRLRLPAPHKHRLWSLYRTSCCQSLYELRASEYDERWWSCVDRSRYDRLVKLKCIPARDPGPIPPGMPLVWKRLIKLSLTAMLLTGLILAFVGK